MQVKHNNDLAFSLMFSCTI